MLGILASLISALDMMLVTEYYANTTKGFFKPFEGYNQIIQKGANYFQIIPVSSSLNISLEEKIETTFSENAIPAYFASYNADLFSFYNRYFMGIPLDDMPSLWDDTGLFAGRWPQNENEILAGYAWIGNDTVTLFNHTFTIVGNFNEQYSFMDRILVGDLNFIQNLTNFPDKVNIFFIPKTIDNQVEAIQSFEDNNPTTDILTQSEIRQIQGEINIFVDNLIQVLTFFTGVSALIFVFAIEILGIFNRKKDFDLLYILGTPRYKIVTVLWIEHIAYVLIGTLISIPLSLLTYGLIFGFIKTNINDTAQFFLSIFQGLDRLFETFPLEKYLNTLGLIIGVNLILSVLVMYLGLRKYNLGDLKEKF